MKLIALFITLTFSTSLCAQYTLDTPDGKRVKLNTDGTWTFLNLKATEGPTNIPRGSTSKYITRFNRYELWYNPAVWIIDTVKKTNSFTWDALLYSSDYALQGYLLESRLSMPFEAIEEGIRQQWKSVGEIKMLINYKDTINNMPLTIYEMEYLQAGVTYKYKGAVYSDQKGSLQFTVGTQKEIFLEDKSKIDSLFKGIIKL